MAKKYEREEASEYGICDISPDFISKSAKCQIRFNYKLLNADKT